MFSSVMGSISITVEFSRISTTRSVKFVSSSACAATISAEPPVLLDDVLDEELLLELEEELLLDEELLLELEEELSVEPVARAINRLNSSDESPESAFSTVCVFSGSSDIAALDVLPESSGAPPVVKDHGGAVRLLPKRSLISDVKET